MYAKASMIVRKSCHELEKEIEVPPLGRMNTNAKCGGGLQTGRVVRSVTIDCQHGDIVFPLVSGIFREYNHDFLQAKSSGYSSKQAQSIAILESPVCFP